MLKNPDAFYGSIPNTILEGIRNYVRKGQRPGHFLSAVISNNLKEAAGRADSDNAPYLVSIVKYFFNETPGTCWGSKETMEEWIAAGGTEAQPHRFEKDEGLADEEG
jgi:hypothetical protein